MSHTPASMDICHGNGQYDFPDVLGIRKWENQKKMRKPKKKTKKKTTGLETQKVGKPKKFEKTSKTKKTSRKLKKTKKTKKTIFQRSWWIGGPAKSSQILFFFCFFCFFWFFQGIFVFFGLSL